MKSIELFFDGGTKLTNPGQGYGSYLIRRDNKVLAHCYIDDLGQGATSNQAEYATLIFALAELSRYAKLTTPIRIYGDSELVITTLRGERQVRNPNIRVLYAIAKNMIMQYEDIKLEHVPRKVSVDMFGH